jgi:hypothetical protein
VNYFSSKVDTWWQTETGGVAISPRPSEIGGKIVPGKPMRPMFGINPVLLDEKVKLKRLSKSSNVNLFKIYRVKRSRVTMLAAHYVSRLRGLESPKLFSITMIDLFKLTSRPTQATISLAMGLTG